eukprot:CAMPEP_0119497512 /NCGR_PEP_ID=MMETSP1344-20130328/20533_1 /TAXON_ID=236787 /ORGANISM="Florenciella parvula, Strain CCMP2471" /LENGTH=141 /DNA_ID=CAMNT_0007533305 /DNA_START=27 /DNA_END=450 /DNA_ORIENTATION=+
MAAQAYAVMSRPQVLDLYKKILKAAARFPSIKREGIIKDIKLEFREHATETDPKIIAQYHLVAQQSYSQLLSFANLDPRSRDWSVTTAETPMPQADLGDDERSLTTGFLYLGTTMQILLRLLLLSTARLSQVREATRGSVG